jgi:hypothetical protein
MGVGEDFKQFCGNLAIRNRGTIADRYALITRRLNIEYWKTDSNTYHSFYTGSYGRGTAISATSDVDMIFRLPDEYYRQYNSYTSNGQSALLSHVRGSLQKTYWQSEVGADGQVVVVAFADGITFEVLPAFLNDQNSYTYPNANDGGSWQITNPKPEITAIDARDAACNGNLKMLARMARAWRAQRSVSISGLLIDTLAYAFIGAWEYRDKSFVYYDWMSRDFFDYLAGQDRDQQHWRSPGAGQYVWRTGLFEWKATNSRNIAIGAIDHQSKSETWAARRDWREIYGTDYPAP